MDALSESCSLMHLEAEEVAEDFVRKSAIINKSEGIYTMMYG